MRNVRRTRKVGRLFRLSAKVSAQFPLHEIVILAQWLAERGFAGSWMRYKPPFACARDVLAPGWKRSRPCQQTDASRWFLLDCAKRTSPWCPESDCAACRYSANLYRSTTTREAKTKEVGEAKEGQVTKEGKGGEREKEAKNDSHPRPTRAFRVAKNICAEIGRHRPNAESLSSQRDTVWNLHVATVSPMPGCAPIVKTFLSVTACARSTLPAGAKGSR